MSSTSFSSSPSSSSSSSSSSSASSNPAPQPQPQSQPQPPPRPRGRRPRQQPQPQRARGPNNPPPDSLVLPLVPVPEAANNNRNADVLEAPTNQDVLSGRWIDLKNRPLLIRWGREDQFYDDDEQLDAQGRQSFLQNNKALLRAFRWVEQTKNPSTRPPLSVGSYEFLFIYPVTPERQARFRTLSLEDLRQPAGGAQGSLFETPTPVCKVIKERYVHDLRRPLQIKCNGYEELKYETITGKWRPLLRLLPQTTEDNNGLQVYFPIGVRESRFLPVQWSPAWLIDRVTIKRTVAPLR